jgi:hypothetical protein
MLAPILLGLRKETKDTSPARQKIPLSRTDPFILTAHVSLPFRTQSGNWILSLTCWSAAVLFLRKQLAINEERQALVIVKPETLIDWHRKGFKSYWKGKPQAG